MLHLGHVMSLIVRKLTGKTRPEILAGSKAAQANSLTRIPNRKDRQFIENRVGVPIHQFSDLDSFLKAGSKNVWATFRACHITASIVASTMFNLRQGDDADAQETGPAFDLWSNPNLWDSRTELIYQWVFHMKLTGVAYWVKDEINSAGQPNQLYPLLPQHVILTPSRTHGVAKYTYRINGNDLDFAPEEIIHFRRPHPTDPLRGLGDIEPSQALYNSYINGSNYEERFLENGAQPSGILTYKGTDEMPADMSDMEDEEWGKLKKWWSGEYSGTKNAGKTAMLSGEWDYTRLGLTHLEMSSIERDKTNVEQIFMNHGVPLSLAGWTNAANYATARQDEINFRRYEVVPLIDIMVDKLNAEGVLFHNFSDKLKLTYEVSGLIDVEQVGKDFAPLVAAGGMTPNELRVKMGEAKSDNELLDQYFAPQGAIPIEMAGGGMATEEDMDALVPADAPETQEPEDTAPEAATTTDAGVEAVTDAESAAPSVSLNGAQIQALVSLATAVGEGLMPKDTAVQIIAASFPFTEERAARMLAEIIEGAMAPAPAPVPTAEAPEQPPEGQEVEGKNKHKALPDKYRPATDDDVPEGQACGNCVHFNEGDVASDGRARCARWDEYVAGGHYCDAWKTTAEAIEGSPEGQAHHNNDDDKPRRPKTRERQPPVATA